MHHRSLSRCSILAGVALLLLGLLLWASPVTDWRFHLLLRAGRQDWTTRTAADLSLVGGLLVMGPVALLVALGFAIRRRRREALWLVVTLVVGRLLVEGIKLAVHRPRPPLADRLADVTSWSFPSSHSAGTMMTALAIAALAGAQGWQIGLALVAALLVGWSRVALAVHWPSDVLAGWGMGMLWMGVAMGWLPVSEPAHPE